jgi:hypothetical protein
MNPSAVGGVFVRWWLHVPSRGMRFSTFYEPCFARLS